MGVTKLKSKGLAPVIVAPDATSGRAPLLLNVTIIGALVEPTAWFGKVKEVGAKPAVVGFAPVPARLIVCGTPVTPAVLLLIVSVARRGPMPVGVKVTCKRQVPPAGIELLQVLLAAKSAEFAPAIGFVNTNGVLPIFCIKRVLGKLVVPTFWRPKRRLVGKTCVRVACGFNPKP